MAVERGGSLFDFQQTHARLAASSTMMCAVTSVPVGALPNKQML